MAILHVDSLCKELLIFTSTWPRSGQAQYWKAWSEAKISISAKEIARRPLKWAR